MARPRFDPDNLVSHAEIAARCEVQVDTVRKWKLRHPDFPEPIAELSIGLVFWWPEILAWVEGRTSDTGQTSASRTSTS